MSSNPELDPVRSRAIRQMLYDNAAQTAPKRRIGRAVAIIALSLAACGLAVGGAAFALNGQALFAPSPIVTSTATPTPQDRDVPTVTPAPTPTVDTMAEAARYAAQACRDVQAGLESNTANGATDPNVWAASSASAKENAATSANLDQTWTGLSAHIAALASAPLPQPPDFNGNAYFSSLYYPVAAECIALGVDLPTD